MGFRRMCPYDDDPDASCLESPDYDCRVCSKAITYIENRSRRMSLNSISRRIWTKWVLWGLVIFQYLFSTWLMVGSGALEGIFMKFDNAGIEGNIMILILYIIAMIANGLSVVTFGEPDLLGILKANKEMDNGS